MSAPERSVSEEIAALPEINATKSRDFGRGYAQAIRDVIEIIEKLPAADASTNGQ